MEKKKWILLLILLAQFICVILGHVFAGSDNLASAFWPAIGFSSIFYLYYGKKTIFPIFLGTFLAQCFNQYILIENPFLTGLWFAFFFTTVSLLEVLLFGYVYVKIKKIIITEMPLIALILSFIVSVSIGGAFVGFMFSILYGTSFTDIGVRWAIGDFFGMTIFGITLYYSLLFDFKYKRKNNLIKLLLFLLVYIALSVIFFYSALGQSDYFMIVILFLPVYVISIIYFKYYTVLILNAIHILLF